MKLTAVFPVHNQFPLCEAVLDVAKQNLSGEMDVEFLVIDNGSDTPFLPTLPLTEKGVFYFRVVRNQNNRGVYPLFWEALDHTTSSDIVAVFHSDVFIAEKGWDKRVIEAFQGNEKLGLLGFIGSNEIDGSGGRGLGTMSNFQGNEYHGHHHTDASWGNWKGSPAEIHGRRETGIAKAAVVDGCVMIFRRSVLEQIKCRPDFPPHHFYDRLLSCEVRELGYEVGVLGVACDHISGQTVNQEPNYHTMAEEWATAHGIAKHEGGWDSTLYLEAEHQWLNEYRDIKHLVPCKV